MGAPRGACAANEVLACWSASLGDTLNATTASPTETPSAPASPPSFLELGVLPATCEALAEIGITAAFRIQELTLPLALAGQDLIGQAKTGTGKTLGFGIPMLQRITAPVDEEWATLATAGKPQALVVAPTRELALQVANDLEQAGKRRSVRVLCAYGGRAYEPQVEALKNGVEIVVGTPGRLIDLMKQRFLDLSNVRVLVLDEADEMLDMGFLPDVETLVGATPTSRQTMLFSATMPGQIINLARRYMSQPTHIRASDPNDDSATVDAIEQHVWRTHSLDKPELLARILQADERGLVMVFTRTKRAAQRVSDDMAERGFASAAVHGDLGQGAREQALRAFRNGKVDLLVATDVAARGIDVDGVTHVVNYECPDDEKTYLHRVGRTGRAGASGVAVTFVDWQDMARWGMINKALGLAFAEPLETYSSSDHVYTGLNIPTTAKGTLPRASRTRAGLGAETVEDLGETGKARSRNRSSGSGDSSKSGSKSSGQGSSSRGSSRSGEAKDAESKPAKRTPRAPSERDEIVVEGADGTVVKRRRRRRSPNSSGGGNSKPAATQGDS
jgi:superfamily II DNA/RNA helicase